MCQQWKDDVLSQAPNGKTIAVNRWLARTTLDVIGEGSVRSRLCHSLRSNWTLQPRLITPLVL